MQDYVGKQIDRYRIIERLGMGGMAVVYKAYDTRLERDVALKLIRTEAIPPEQYIRLMKRFEREAKAQARFNHRHIVVVYDYGEVDGAPYLVMSYIPGGTLKLRTGRQTPYEQALRWLIPIADALYYAHDLGVIHRDIKPSNILFDANDQPVLTDFGIAKLLETDEATLTGTGLGVGTPEYMAPEQWQGKASPATDQYALGVVLYELLTGQKPYTADTPAMVAIQQATEPLRSPRELAGSIPEVLEKVLYKALSRHPQDRYEDMYALRKALEKVSAGEPISSTPLLSPDPQPALDALSESELRSFDSEGETRDLLDTGTEVPAAPVPEKNETKRRQVNWLLWGGAGAIVLIIGMVLLIWNLVSGLAGRTETAPEVNPTVEVTLNVAATDNTAAESQLLTLSPTGLQAPTATPTLIDRFGAWLDQIVLIADPSVESAVARIIADDINVYAQSATDVEALATVEAQGLKYITTVGSYNEITLSPGGPILNDGTLNPFGVPKIREAMNYLLSRDYVVQEILGGLGIPKFLPINGVFPDYANFVDVARELENKYAYDPAKADEIITEEMEALGASKEGGVWTYEGEPVVLIAVIRTEDERLQMGDYVSNQLETIGFTVDRQYKTASEASPIWLMSNPQDGLWHLYTGGWITTAISRDDGDVFQFFYSPKSDYGLFSLWQNYVISDEFDAVAEKLATNAFTSIEERGDLFREALYLAMESSYRIWLNDSTSFSPMGSNVTVAYDLAGGISGTPLWAHTLRYTDKVGGEMVVAMTEMLVDPWNPLGGSNWDCDRTAQKATSDFGVIHDPYTGLALPQRIERAEITAEAGLPIQATMDWVVLNFATQIVVPDDAWVDWDADRQEFITAREKRMALGGESQTAKIKSVVSYPDTMFDQVTWHDGSPLSMADFVMGMILSFDPGTEGSIIFDDSQVGSVDAYKSDFKGFKITSTDPLVIECYTDTWYMDAENNVWTFWPQYSFGEAPWHTLTLGILAESKEQGAFTADKAERIKVEWMDYIYGNSLGTLSNQLDDATIQNYIPYESTLGQYLQESEVRERYYNLKNWYMRKGHFWVGTGPLFLERIDKEGKIIILRRYEGYSDRSGKWDDYSSP